MDNPPNNFGLDGDVTSDDSVQRSIAGNALLDALRVELDGVEFGRLKIVQSNSVTAAFQYLWCEPLNRFLRFLSMSLKLSAATCYHDAIKYLIFRTLLGGNGRLEVRHGKHRIDLVDGDGHWHEVKTREVRVHGELAAAVRHFLRQVHGDVAGRDIWWLCFLRACKGIKTRACSTYLGLMRLPAAVARAATRKADFNALAKELVNMADDAESKLVGEEDLDEDELEEGFLFGVENQVTKSLRKEVIDKNKDLKRKNAELQRKDAELQRKDAENQRLCEENERLKDEHRHASNKNAKRHRN